MEFGSQSITTPHVLIFPLPMQGPVNSMLKLAELLILSTNDIHVTFLTTDVVYHHLLLSARAHERFDHNPRFSFCTFSDGLPEDHPRGGHKFLEMLDAVIDVSQPIVKDLVSSSNSTKVTSIVSDGLFSFSLDVGNESGIPVFYFETMSPCCLWVYLCLPKLVQHDGKLPFTRENSNLDALINIPGMDDYLRLRDLPDFCRARDVSDHVMLQRVLAMVKQIRSSQGIIVNTFKDLHAPLLSYMRSHCPKIHIYTIGPLHFSLTKRLQEKTLLHQPLVSSFQSNSFLHEDRSCMSWLDEKPPRSVIYCSFGSQVSITKEQLVEFWHGLVNSGVLFLWIKRPGSVIGMDDEDNNFEMMENEMLINREVIEGIKKRGCIMSWAPQVEVLSHPAIGGFLTHSGWNSTMESVVAGLPMVCWPHYVDQLVISRMVTEVWKIGVDIKDSCDRANIEKMVNELMHLRKDEFMKNSSYLAALASKSVNVGGSSYGSLESLINDIRSEPCH